MPKAKLWNNYILACRASQRQRLVSPTIPLNSFSPAQLHKFIWRYTALLFKQLYSLHLPYSVVNAVYRSKGEIEGGDVWVASILKHCRWGPDNVPLCFNIFHFVVPPTPVSNNAWRNDPCEPVDFLISPCIHFLVLTICIFPSQFHIHTHISGHLISKALLTCILRINIVLVLCYLMAHPNEMEQLENETQTSQDVNESTALGNGVFSAEPRHQDQESSTGDEHEMMLVRAEAARPKLNRIPSW